MQYNDEYNIAVNYLRSHKDDESDDVKLMRLLVNQYCCGSEPKDELKCLCKRMGLWNWN